MSTLRNLKSLGAQVRQGFLSWSKEIEAVPFHSEDDTLTTCKGVAAASVVVDVLLFLFLLRNRDRGLRTRSISNALLHALVSDLQEARGNNAMDVKLTMPTEVGRKQQEWKRSRSTLSQNHYGFILARLCVCTRLFRHCVTMLVS